MYHSEKAPEAAFGLSQDLYTKAQTNEILLAKLAAPTDWVR